jgi:hypothetical protein
MDTDCATYSFGLGASGQLGLGSGEERNTSEPTLVPGLLGKSIKEIECGEAHVAALSGLLIALHNSYNRFWGSLYIRFQRVWSTWQKPSGWSCCNSRRYAQLVVVLTR